MRYLGPEDRSQINEQLQDDMLLEDALEKEKAAQPIVVGQLWAVPKDGPWGGHYPPVKVLDVRDGWVRYGYPQLFTDCRIEEAAFRKNYRRVEGA